MFKKFWYPITRFVESLYRPLRKFGDPEILHQLARKYYWGEDISKDVFKALKLWKEAAKQGHSKSQHNLAALYSNGDDIPKDDAKALKWFRKAAEQGNADSQYYLGEQYATGGLIPKNIYHAVKWYERAATQGNVPAQINLGAIYYLGDGVLRDYTKAKKYWEQAAEQNDVAGQFNLGLLYEYGKGVEKDINKAVEWYRKSATQGDDKAKQKLERIYPNNTLQVNIPKRLTIEGRPDLECFPAKILFTSSIKDEVTGDMIASFTILEPNLDSFVADSQKKCLSYKSIVGSGWRIEISFEEESGWYSGNIFYFDELQSMTRNWQWESFFAHLAEGFQEATKKKRTLH